MTKPARIDAAAHWVINVRKPMIPVYILPRVPGAAETTKWTDFCHKEVFITIDHHRFTKDYSAERKRRQFQVGVYRRNKRWRMLIPAEYWFDTLAAAQAFAAKQAKEEVR